jgi:hypothetical protein
LSNPTFAAPGRESGSEWGPLKNRVRFDSLCDSLGMLGMRNPLLEEL